MAKYENRMAAFVTAYYRALQKGQTSKDLAKQFGISPKTFYHYVDICRQNGVALPRLAPPNRTQTDWAKIRELASTLMPQAAPAAQSTEDSEASEGNPDELDLPDELSEGEPEDSRGNLLPAWQAMAKRAGQRR